MEDNEQFFNSQEIELNDKIKNKIQELKKGIVLISQYDIQNNLTGTGSGFIFDSIF